MKIGKTLCLAACMAAMLLGTVTYAAAAEETTPAETTLEETTPAETTPVETEPEVSLSLQYSAHVQSYGDLNMVAEGEYCGTMQQAKRLEGITIQGTAQNMTGGIEYRTHVQSYGWLPYVSGGTFSGTRGESKRAEALQIRLTGEWAEKYDVYYRAYCQTYGWLDWTCNDGIAGTTGYGKRLEGFEVRLVKKGESFSGAQANPNRIHRGVSYCTHVQTYGWQSWQENGSLAGTTGQAKRMEAIQIKLFNMPYSGDVVYSTHVQSYGWLPEVANGALSGTTGQAKRMEAIRIKLTGEMAEHYDIYYRVHAQTLGWLDWAKNGEEAGTAGFAKRLEGIEIRLVDKGGAAPGSTGRSFVGTNQVGLSYFGHVQGVGDTSWCSAGTVLGSTDGSKTLQGVGMQVAGGPLSGGISYKVYSKAGGWQEAYNGNFAGARGQDAPLEAIEIRLSGELGKMYDVYYRVCIKNHGWLGWARNGQTAGSTINGKVITAVEVRLQNHSYGGGFYNGNYYLSDAKQGWYYENGYKLYYNNGQLVTDVEGIIGAQSSYLLQVNVTCNVVNVFAADGDNGYIIPVKTFVCSTSANFGDTPLGTHHTQAKYRWHELMGPCWGQWCTRIVGGVLFHSVYFNSYCDHMTLSVNAYNKLGTNASHGCVRLTSGAAKWIYDNCAVGTTVEVISSNYAGPFGKPSAHQLPSWHTWDPTDPTAYYRCQQTGCH